LKSGPSSAASAASPYRVVGSPLQRSGARWPEGGDDEMTSRAQRSAKGIESRDGEHLQPA
jgi:hypothetical protein